MARRRGSIEHGTALLTTLRGGINRFPGDATGDQLVDALDVVVDDGDLRRRDAWKSIGHGVPFFLPHGRTILKYSNDNITFGTVSDRTPVGTLSKKYWLVGCTEKFDGFFWPSRWLREIAPIDSFTTGLTLSIYGFNGISNFFTPAVNTTSRWDPASERVIPLIGRGCVTWHSDSESWSTQAIDGVTAYWVRLALTDPLTNTGFALTPHLDAPGVQVFHLAPVTGIINTKVRGRRARIVGSDRTPTRGLERGSELGELTNEYLGVQRIWYAFDEGAGLYDVDSFTRGTAGRLTKDRTTDVDDTSIAYAWLANQHQGGRVIARQDSAAYQGVDVDAATASTVSLSEAATSNDNKFEHCRLRVTRNVAGGASVDYERAVVSSTAAGVLTFEDAFDATPNTDNDVVVLLPHAKLRILSKVASIGGSEMILDAFEIYRTFAGHTLELAGVGAETLGVPYVSNPPAALEGLPVYWMIAKELRWMLDAGHYWEHAYDHKTDAVYLCNGRNVVIYDGQKVRPAGAVGADDAALYRYRMGSDAAADVNEDIRSEFEKGVFPFPSEARFLRVWAGRLFVFGARVFQWSVPNNFDWWLGSNVQNIPEDSKGEIRGSVLFGERLIVYTATSMFELTQALGTKIAVRQISHSIGWVSNRGVAQITQSGVGMLIGPTPWGLAAWNGGEPSVVLDAWSRVFDEEPSPADLVLSTSAILQQSNFYLLGVGNRILVFDWVQRRFWLWSVPWGVRSMTVELNELGRERLLVGTEDGHIVTLANGLEDDGIEAINARAQCALKAPNGSNEVVVYRGMVLSSEQQSGVASTLKLFFDRRSKSGQSVSIYPTAQRPTWGTAWVTGSSVLKWAEAEMRGVDFGIRNGTRCEQLSVSISGTAPFRIREIEVFGRGLARRGRSG